MSVEIPVKEEKKVGVAERERAPTTLVGSRQTNCRLCQSVEGLGW